jgi:hypothetical protein
VDLDLALTAQVDPRILAEAAPAVYVAHDPHGSWRVGAHGFVELAPATFQAISLTDVRSIDDSIGEVFDLMAGWHAFRAGLGGDWARAPMPEGIVYLLSYELRPSPANSDVDGIGGAFVNCWVKRPSLDVAVQFAAEHLRESGWLILSDGKTRSVVVGDLPEESARYFRQAEVDGEVFVIHSFPPEAPDA